MKENEELQTKIKDLLATKGPLTRDELCSQLGFTGQLDEYKYKYSGNYRVKIPTGKSQPAQRTTVYDSLAKLMGRGIVVRAPVKNPAGKNKRGRPKVIFSLK